MLKIKELLYFYRILNWENKISAVRPLGYAFFGYLMAGELIFLPIFINSLAVFGLLIFGYALGDYYDFKKSEEGSFLSSKIIKGELSEKKAFIYCLAPLIFTIPFFFLGKVFPVAKLTIIIFFIGFLILASYSAPPFRIKERKLYGFFIIPLGTTLLFLGSFSLLGNFDLTTFFLIILLFIFQCYIETRHVLEDSLMKEEVKKMSQAKGIKLLKRLPLISLIFSLGFSFYNLAFLITSFFSLIRIIALRNFKIEDVWRIRKNLFLPHWSLYEFLIYGALGIFHLM